MREIKFRAFYPNCEQCQDYLEWKQEKRNMWIKDKIKYESLSIETFERETGKEYIIKPYKYMDYDIHLSKKGKPMYLEGGWDYMSDDDDALVMQYTGLKDKNGKEIYEGDLVKYDEDESMNHWVAGSIAQIISLPGRFIARMSPFEKYNGCNQNTLNEDFEDSVIIIGNIYENPDLLTK